MPSRTRRAVTVLTAALALAPGAAHAAGCPPEATSRPYVLYLDTNSYFLAPGGTFERGDVRWATTGAAHTDPVGRLNDFGGSSAMRLPLLSSATSPPVCVDATRKQLRFDVKGAWLLSRLRVDAVRPDGRVVPLGATTALLDTLLWGVSPPIPLTRPLGIEGDEVEHVRLRFTALSGPFAIDDVAVDPYRQG